MFCCSHGANEDLATELAQLRCLGSSMTTGWVGGTPWLTSTWPWKSPKKRKGSMGKSMVKVDFNPWKNVSQLSTQGGRFGTRRTHTNYGHQRKEPLVGLKMWVSWDHDPISMVEHLIMFMSSHFKYWTLAPIFLFERCIDVIFDDLNPSWIHTLSCDCSKPKVINLFGRWNCLGHDMIWKSPHP